MTRFTISPVEPPKILVATVWPLTERDYDERTHFAVRNTLVGTSIPCIPYAPLEYAVFLDINEQVVEMNFKEPA